ncbi:MAG: glycoside hydrolase family 99-like domain-containing protein [Bryobacter sp.]|nr:glycoside hydrolase family 99-like domain-containing protein [Bryobacter sp.]
MRRRDFLGAAAAPLAAQSSPYQVGVYYFPNYHVDPLNEKAHGPGWTEWDLVKQARPRWPGHQQPKQPLWGYEDEADPRVMARKIDAAASHGITHFIFDWYWYQGGPFLERCLNDGYLKAPNRGRVKFCLMWANHDWVDIHPAKLGPQPPLQFPGAVDAAGFDRMTDHIVRDYFLQPSHWTIGGKPYFSIYELFRLIEGLGGVDATRKALDRFRAKTRDAGLPGLHLNAVLWGVKILPGEKTVQNPHVPLKQFPETPYAEVMAAAAAHWTGAAKETGLPYHPNTTMGWDSSPRTVQTDGFIHRGYPFMPALGGNTPEAFEQALRRMKTFLDQRPGEPRICNLNAWNEWTEGSYLEPDTRNGMRYLEAIRRVFGTPPR